MTTTSPMSIHVIIPVKSMAAHLARCLDALMPQLSDADRITVVDDGSTDATGDVAIRAGAELIRRSSSAGPYAARNQAARGSQATALLFVDARCRPLAGWLATHRRLLAEPEAVLSCTNVEVERGRSLASRIAVIQEPFRIDTRVGMPGRWDWYPTANLGVRRTAFEAVGGFREIRSGGDEDLCRRIQQAGLGRMAADFATYMTWQPRDELKQLYRQWYRYGKGAAMLQASMAKQPAVTAGTADGSTTGSAGQSTAGQSSTAGTVRRLARHALHRPADAPAVAGMFLVQLAFLAGKYAGSRARPQPGG